MKNLRLIVLRELDHFRGWFYLLLGLAGFTVLLHVLVLTILPGMYLAEFLVVMKSYVVPGVFGILCAMMGYADSPEHGSHEFKTRPVRLKTLYLGKVTVIAGTAVALVLVQALMSWFAGFPLGLWKLWVPLFLVGLGFFFLAALLRPTIFSALQLVVVIRLPWALGDLWHVFLRGRDGLAIYPMSFLALSFVSAVYLFGVFLAKNSLRKRYLWGLFIPLAALVVGAGVWLLPVGQRVVSADLIEGSLEERFRPELRFEPLSNGMIRLEVIEPKSDQGAIHRLRFESRVVELVGEGGTMRRIPIFQRSYSSFDSSEEDELLMALGLVPRYTEEQLDRIVTYTPNSRLVVSGSRNFEIPAELRGQSLEIRSEGVASYWETESLGVLPIRVGKKINNKNLSVEIVDVDDGKYLISLRVHARNGARIRLGAFQKNLENPSLPYGEIKWLTNHGVIDGMSTVDIMKVDIHKSQIEESPEVAVLHLFSMTYRGVAPFRSKSVLFDGKKSLEKRQLMKADYPIRPSISATESE